MDSCVKIVQKLSDSFGCDAKWSNGDAVTAADFVFGWQRAVDKTSKKPRTAKPLRRCSSGFLLLRRGEGESKTLRETSTANGKLLIF